VTRPSIRSLPTTLHHREKVMGTIVTFDLYGHAGVARRQVSPYLERAAGILHRADHVFSTWNPESAMSRLRRGEITLGEAPDEVLEVLDECRGARSVSDGWFDPWAIEGGVDPTGYVKGWAAQRALDALREAPLDGAMVNAAGDIASFGGPATSQPFRIAIVDPAATHQITTVVDLRGALATSGAYERGAHLVNPRTGVAATQFASASVTGPDLGRADALATALCVGGAGVLSIIERLPDYEAFALDRHGTRRWTTGFPFAREAMAGL
jgi:FAD:protein FMN transferase